MVPLTPRAQALPDCALHEQSRRAVDELRPWCPRNSRDCRHYSRCRRARRGDVFLPLRYDDRFCNDGLRRGACDLLFLLLRGRTAREAP